MFAKNLTHSTAASVFEKLRFDVDSTAIRLPFDIDSTAIRPRHDQSTNYFTTVELPCVDW